MAQSSTLHKGKQYFILLDSVVTCKSRPNTQLAAAKYAGKLNIKAEV